MKRSIARMTVLLGLLVTLLSISSSITVHAASVCLSNAGIDATSSARVAVNAGDSVVATITTYNPDDFGTILIWTDIGPIIANGNIGGTSVSIKIPFSGHVSALFQGIPASGADSDFTWTLSVNGGCPGGSTGPLFHDGRLNAGDGAETAAIYCDKGAVIVYYIGSPWQVVLDVTTAEIDRVPSLPAQNTIIKQNKKVGVALYRLTSGELQVNAPGGSDGKGPYSYIFTDCPRDH